MIINIGCKTINKLHLSIGVKCILKNNSIQMSVQKDQEQRVFGNFLSASSKGSILFSLYYLLSTSSNIVPTDIVQYLHVLSSNTRHFALHNTVRNRCTQITHELYLTPKLRNIKWIVSTIH